MEARAENRREVTIAGLLRPEAVKASYEKLSGREAIIEISRFREGGLV